MYQKIICSLLLLTVTACSSGSDSGRTDQGGSAGADFECDGGCAHQSLSQADVEQVLRQAVAATQSLGTAGTFAVVDRVGNVLAVYQMRGAPANTTINGQIGAVGGLEGVSVPSVIAAISKAGTGAYLSSQGNAFSTRTASQIVQENFNPGERNQPGGPLFGVQFSQLICSDVNVRQAEFAMPIPSGRKFVAGGSVGPRPLPLGLSADPGGLPLYKNGDLVGGIGVEFDGLYTIDRNVMDFDDDPEERVALGATLGFEAPSKRIAPNMNPGKSLRYTDLSYNDIEPLPEVLGELDPSLFVAVPEYSGSGVRSGATFGSPQSGITIGERIGLPVAVLTRADGTARFPTRNGSSLAGAELSVTEVNALLDSAVFTAFRTRAAIRRPLDTSARVSIWVVDHLGNPLGFVRTQDGPLCGIDVSLQKARTAAFFSSADAGEKINQIRANNAVGSFEDYVAIAQAFSNGDIFSGNFAFGARSIGNMSRPFFTDGLIDNDNGPFSLPFPGKKAGRSWSPFNTGLQLDLAFQRVVGALGVPTPATQIADACVDRSVVGSRLANGMQIFPGGVPLYRAGTLVGAIGISGDGVDQDDLIAFYSASRNGLDAVGHTSIGNPDLGFNAPREIRADNINNLAVSGTRLRYVNCPEGPFRGSNDQKVCDGF